MGTNVAFSKWLQGELARRGWNQADLARASRLAKSTISNILIMQRAPGPAVCLAIAAALELPPEVVFSRAGLLPELENTSQLQQEVEYKLSRLTPDQQMVVLDLIDSLLKRSEKKAGKGT